MVRYAQYVVSVECPDGVADDPDFDARVDLVEEELVEWLPKRFREFPGVVIGVKSGA